MAEIAKLGHVQLVTPSLEESSWFFREVIGLKEVDRIDDTVFLRAQRDVEHHTLSLTEGSRAALGHVGWQTRSPAALDLLADRLESTGVDLHDIDSDEEVGQGRGIRFRIPAGHQFELYYDIEQPAAPEAKRSRLKNRVYSQTDSPLSTPKRIDHVQLRGPRVPETIETVRDTLGFRLIERAVDEQDAYRGGWWTTNTLAHTLAYLRGETPTFHHVAFYYDTLEDIWDAADVVTEHGIEIDAGPGKHGITRANYLHVQDPGSGHRIELFNGGYQVFTPDWEPIEWTPDDMTNQPWFGHLDATETTPAG